MEDYIQAISTYLSSKGGLCLLSALGEGVKRYKPNGAGKLKVIIEKHHDRFGLNLRSNGHYEVHLITPTTHAFHDLSLKQMFTVLHTMHTYYRGRSWPTERDQWGSDYEDCMGFHKKGSSTLFLLRNGGYVTVNKEKKLFWNMRRIHDALNQMPDKMKAVGSTQANGSSVKQSRQLSLPSNGGNIWKMADGIKCILVDSGDSLATCVATNAVLNGDCGSEKMLVAVDCEGVPETLELIQISLPNRTVIIFDCRVVGVKEVCRALEPLLVSKDHVKLMHDCHKDALALAIHGQVSIKGVLDSQLVAEYLWGEPFIGFNGLMKKLELNGHHLKDFVHARMKSGVDVFGQRPIPRNALEYAALDVSLLHAAAETIKDRLSGSEMTMLLQASQLRASGAELNDGARSICFDTANEYLIASAELLRTCRPAQGFFGEILQVANETKQVIDLLPARFRLKFDSKPREEKSVFRRLLSLRQQDEILEVETNTLDLDRLNDIVLDIGRRPQCWIGDERVFLVDNDSIVVSADDLKHVSDRLGEFGSDNRAGLNGKLHRFSAIRNRDDQIAGLTVRIGRHVFGNAAMFLDLLYGDKSILILGEPGSGKTTIVREATRKLAESKNVFVVDTSNEIAGDGLIPHDCIGLARRMMVPSLDRQSAVMVECVQNHTPHVMVIDEIGRPKEVEAARTVKQRGVRIIASAHGDLRKLLKNKDLRGLVGGIEVVTMGDDMAKQEAKRKKDLAVTQGEANAKFSVCKTKVERASEPTFDVIVEVRRGSRHEWRIVPDAAKAVDAILNGFSYKAELRSRDSETGELRMKFVNA